MQNKLPDFDKDLKDIKERYSRLEDQAETPEGKAADGYMLGLHFVLCAILPAMFGLWLDNVLETPPFFLISLLILGFCAGIWHIWQRMDS